MSEKKTLLETSEGRNWQLLDTTERAAKEWQEQESMARNALMAACRQSSDPRVTAAYEKLTAFEKIRKYLSGT